MVVRVLVDMNVLNLSVRSFDHSLCFEIKKVEGLLRVFGDQSQSKAIGGTGEA